MKNTSPSSESVHSSNHEEDPHWLLVERIVASRHLNKAPLLSKFLLHICEELLSGRQAEITGYQIGVRVFDRPPDYRTVEDNIVRNYARQLRKRLVEYFAAEGLTEPVRIEIPLGGYVPVFVPREVLPGITPLMAVPVRVPINGPNNLPTIAPESGPPAIVSEAGHPKPRRPQFRWLALYSVALVGVTLAATLWLTRKPSLIEPARPLWAALFHSPLDTYIVPADCGFNMVEDLAQRNLSLSDYLRSDYLTVPLPAMDAHSSSDLRTQEFTSFVDLEVVSSLSRLPEVDPQHLILRFPRDLRLADLKHSNVILIGSIGSNPWTEVLQKNVNFRVLYRDHMQEAWISNSNPQPGEASSYASHWNEPAHETYALITFRPNLAGTGHLLVIQGLDVAGTQAAAETLFRGDAIAPVLKKALLPGGTLRSFEVLLQSTSLESNAANTQIIASRIY